MCDCKIWIFLKQGNKRFLNHLRRYLLREMISID